MYSSDNANLESEVTVTTAEVNHSVISECLAYISHNINKYASHTIKDTVANFYTEAEISVAKEKITQLEVAKLVPSIMTKRTGSNKQFREVDDILAFFKVIDEKQLEKSLPDFLAKNLDRLPRTNIEHENIASVLSRLSMLESKMQDVTQQNINLSKEMSEVKQQLGNKSSVSIIPSYSGAVAPPNPVTTSGKPAFVFRNHRLTSLADSAVTDNESENEFITVQRKKRKAENSVLAAGNTTSGPASEQPARRKPAAKGTSSKSGLSGGEDCFNVFVYHVQKGQGSDTVKKFMEDSNVKVFKIDKVSHEEAKFESFAVNVERQHYETLCGTGAAEFWPANIRCRPYNKPRTTDTGGTLTRRQ